MPWLIAPDAAFLGLRGLLRQAMEREDWAEAAALARQAEAVHPGGSLAAARAGAAGGACRELVGCPGIGGCGHAEGGVAAAAAEAEPDAAARLRLAKQAWKDDPSLAPAALAYAAGCDAAGRESRALAAIRHSWTIAPHPDLAEFALAPVTGPLPRMQAAQELTEANPEHVESRLLLARAALDAGLTGEARRHAEAAAPLA